MKKKQWRNYKKKYQILFKIFFLSIVCSLSGPVDTIEILLSIKVSKNKACKGDYNTINIYIKLKGTNKINQLKNISNKLTI